MAKNGKLSGDDLFLIGNGGHKLTLEAGLYYLKMKADAEADGVYWTNTDSYRDYDAQVDLKARKPKLAAKPGTSEHGWGEALDLALPDMSSGVGKGTAQFKWLQANGAKYGFYTLTSKPEPWHWEYRGGATVDLDDNDQVRLATVNPKRSIPAIKNLKPRPPGEIPGGDTAVASKLDTNRPPPVPMPARPAELYAYAGPRLPMDKPSALTRVQMLAAIPPLPRARPEPSATNVPMPKDEPDDVRPAAPPTDHSRALGEKPVEYATLPSGKQIALGPQRNDKGELVMIGRDEAGRATITKAEIPWYLREGATIAGAAVREAMAGEAKKAIGAAAGAVVDLVEPVESSVDAAKRGAIAGVTAGIEGLGRSFGQFAQGLTDLQTDDGPPDDVPTLASTRTEQALMRRPPPVAPSVAAKDELKAALEKRFGAGAVGTREAADTSIYAGLGLRAAPPSDIPTMADTRKEQRSTAKLRTIISSAYSDVPRVTPADEGELEDQVERAIPLRPATVIPKDTVGRWEISPTRVADMAVTIKPATLTTSIAFAVHAPPLSRSMGGQVAMALDRFTMPPSVTSKVTYEKAPPKPPFELLDGTAYKQSMDRRDELIKARTPAAKPASKGVVIREADTRKEQSDMRTARAAAKPPSLSTVKPPAAVAPTPMPARPVVVDKQFGKVAPVPMAKPAFKTVTTANPAYVEWEKKYGTVAPAVITEAETRSEQAMMRARAAAAPAQAPTPMPPPPPRTITKKVEVAAPAPTAAPPPSALTGGLYKVAPGDTLSAISRRTGVSVAELQRINGIEDANKIYAGATIRTSPSATGIPANQPSRSAAAAAASGAARPSNNAPASTGGGTITGSATGREYVVGQIYVNSQGVQKMAMADGSFKRV